jgi:hypothetical protein
VKLTLHILISNTKHSIIYTFAFACWHYLSTFVLYLVCTCHVMHGGGGGRTTRYTLSFSLREINLLLLLFFQIIYLVYLLYINQLILKLIILVAYLNSFFDIQNQQQNTHGNRLKIIIIIIIIIKYCFIASNCRQRRFVIVL